MIATRGLPDVVDDVSSGEVSAEVFFSGVVDGSICRDVEFFIFQPSAVRAETFALRE